MSIASPVLNGVHHTARPTWKLRETVEFYRDKLGLPLVHAISARGWGPSIDRAKGLEFEHVIIPGLDRGEFDGQTEDEANLFYVAVSRARHVVQLIHSPGKAGRYVPARLA